MVNGCCCCCQVCPANWKPGDKTIIADPERSLDYFEKAHKVIDHIMCSLVSCKRTDFARMADKACSRCIDPPTNTTKCNVQLP